jgi:hypothetical protein
LYILENLQIQVAPGATYKTAHLQLVPSALDSVTWNHIFKRKKMEEGEKKRRIVLNGGRERMELKKLKKQDWSTSTYSGEVPEEMRWKGRDMNS